jgi:NitT/TauT family transport system permease protein
VLVATPTQPRAQRLARSSGRRTTLGVLAAQIGTILVGLVVWQLLTGVIDRQFLSPPSAVFAAIPSLFADPKIASALGSAFVELAIAFAIAVVAGLAIAIPVGLNTFSYKTVFPIILLLYAIPQIAILPLFILYFGLGPPSKIAFGASHGIFPIMLNVVAGIRSIRPIYLSAARTMGASWPQIVRRIILPYVLAGLFTGMRLAMSITLLGVMLAELYVSSSGIGYYTSLFSNQFNATNLLALIMVLALMAIVLNETVRRLELRFTRWRRAQG